jgi:hypothetical protein
MRIANGRKIPEAVDFANMGDSARLFDNVGDILEEVSNLLGSTIDGDDLAADAGVFAGALTVGGLLTGAAGLGLTGNAAISGNCSAAVLVGTSGASINSGLISVGEGCSLVSGITTGLKIASAANQKLSIWGTTPTVQPTSSSIGALSITGGTYGFETEAERTLVVDKIEAINTMLKTIGLYAEAE